MCEARQRIWFSSVGARWPLARHYREFEGPSIAQIAERLGRSAATIKAYFYDPTGEKAQAVKARYVVGSGPTTSIGGRRTRCCVAATGIAQA